MAPIEANNLARHYAAGLDKAQELLDSNVSQQIREAVNICLRLRLSPHLGIYARARMNLILATAYTVEYPNDTHYTLLYAYEVLDLLDIHRQKYDDDEVSKADQALLKSMEEKAKDIIDAKERSRLNEEKLQENREGTERITDELEDMQIRSPIKKDPDDKPGAPKLVWVNSTTPEVRAQIAANREKNPPLQIEGYLRQAGEYEDIVKYVPLSREPQLPPLNTLEPGEKLGLPTPEPTSDLRAP